MYEVKCFKYLYKERIIEKKMLTRYRNCSVFTFNIICVPTGLITNLKAMISHRILNTILIRDRLSKYYDWYRLKLEMFVRQNKKTIKNINTVRMYIMCNK